MGAFRKKLLSNTIKLPTQMGFRLDKWERLWSDANDPSDKDIYLAGKFIFDQLERARGKVAELYETHAPKTNYTQLLKLYCAMSNRDAGIALRGFNNPEIFEGNIFSQTNSSNKFGNELTAEEIAIGCVDGLELAISSCIKSLRNNKVLPRSTAPLDPMVFIEREANISQTYTVYQDYWHSILYREYEVKGLEGGQEIEIIQPLTKREVAYLISHTRRMRLSATNFISVRAHEFVESFDDTGILSVVGSGKDRRIKVEIVGTKPDPVRYKNTDYLFSTGKIIDEFSEELIGVEHNSSGFTIKECLMVFRNLMFLADSIIDRFPRNDECLNANKLLEFCPVIKSQELLSSLVKVTDFPYSKVLRIVDFLTFSGDRDSDLWAAPLIFLGSNKYSLLVGAVAAPLLERVVERWLVKLGIDLTVKGTPFERKLIEQIEIGMKKCNYPNLLSYPVSATITLQAVREQIDVIFRLGNLVIVGEVKSVVATDSSVSFSHLSEILEGAAQQVKRKANFVSSDIKTCFARLGWDYHAEEKYQVVPIIVNSNRVLVGSSVSDVPILDDKIIQAYFVKGDFPLLSAGHEIVKHIASFKVHSNEHEFVGNFIRYINNPPQTLGGKSSFEYKKVGVLHFGGVERVSLKRLVSKNYSAREMVNREYPFPVHTVEDIEKYLAEMAVLI